MRSAALELVGQSLRCFSQVGGHEQMNVIRQPCIARNCRRDYQRLDLYIQLFGFPVMQGMQILGNLARQYSAAIFMTPYQQVLKRENAVRIALISGVAHRTSVLYYSMFVYYLFKKKGRTASSAC
jgi:hypothetical protein